MNNQQIARVLAEIADVLEIREENPFKIRAYQRAAQTIRSLPEELSSLRQRGPLTAIAGIGKSIAEKIEELLDTGESRFHRELLENVIQYLEHPSDFFLREERWIVEG